MDGQVVRMGGYQGPASVHNRAAYVLGDVLADRTGGEASLTLTEDVTKHGRNSLDLFDMVEGNELDLCYFASSYLVHRIPNLAAFDLPFAIRDRQKFYELLDNELGEVIKADVARRTGFVVLGFWDNGFRHFTNRLRPVHSPADVAGMTVRLQPNAMHEAMVEAWGGTPVAVELSEGIQLIQELKVDAQENPLGNSVAYGVDKVHKYVTMTGHLYGARGIYANRRVLADMPAEIAQAVRASARDAIVHQRSIAADYELELRERLTAQGLEFIDLTPDEREAFVAPTRHIGA